MSTKSGKVVARLRASFHSGKTRCLQWREQQLTALISLLDDHQDALLDALHRDVGKSKNEALITELLTAKSRIVDFRKNVRRYTKVQKVPTMLAVMPGKSQIVTEPLGVVLVISPWNFPIDLALPPLAGAIAAGNCVVLKPSEVAPCCSALLAQLLAQYLDQECVQVLQGGVEETTELLGERFDHILYTGSGTVGRIVMQAAAQHLTPVTLELGGKCPAIVDKSCDLKVSARRMVWGKFLNCGQVCLAPDYQLVHRDIFEEWVELVGKTIVEFYGENPQESPDYGRLVNQRHHQRVLRLLEGGGTVAHGGKSDQKDNYIAPTVLVDVPLDSAIMQEEIFGPLLPVVPIDDVEEAISFVNARPRPLALYFFGQDSKSRDAVIDRTSSGGVGVNQTVLHVLGPHLPFGGVGESGMGAYHGHYSVDTFSHKKSVMERATFIDPQFVYPPMTDAKLKWLKRFA